MIWLIFLFFLNFFFLITLPYSKRSRRFICLQKKHVLQSNFLERVLIFCTISLAFSRASVIPALLKPFIAITLSTLRVLYRSKIHFACSGLIKETLRETLTSPAVFPALNCFDTSLASQESYLSEIKDLK